MQEIVVLEKFSLASQGPTFSLSLGPGQSLAIVGRAGAGKSRLIRCLRGLDKAGQGSVYVSSRPAVAGGEGCSKRSKPQSIVRKHAKGKKQGHAAEALMACCLWDFKLNPLSSLSTSQIAACELLPCLAAKSKLLLIDGQLDRLDPWTLASVLEELRKRLNLGSAVVVATNRPELMSQFDQIVFLEQSQPIFADKFEEFLSHGPEVEFMVESKLQEGVRALVDPFRIDVRDEGARVLFRASEGQETAAKLLLEGYGDIQYVITRSPTAEQTLMHLTKSRHRRLKTPV